MVSWKYLVVAVTNVNAGAVLAYVIAAINVRNVDVAPTHPRITAKPWSDTQSYVCTDINRTTDRNNVVVCNNFTGAQLRCSC